MIGNAAIRERKPYRVVAVLDEAAARKCGHRLHRWVHDSWMLDYRTESSADPFASDSPGIRWALLDDRDKVLNTNHPLWIPRLGATMDFAYFG